MRDQWSESWPPRRKREEDRACTLFRHSSKQLGEIQRGGVGMGPERGNGEYDASRKYEGRNNEITL